VWINAEKCKTFVQNNAKNKEKYIDFYMNVYYIVIRTFEEGRLCIEKLQLFWNNGKKVSIENL
jgi:hypothetical protein